MRPWQERALRKGRTPLPERPGDRPWLNQSDANDEPADGGNDPQETSGPRASATSTPAEAVRTHATRAYTAARAVAGPSADAAANDSTASAEATEATETVDEVTAPEASSATPGTTESSAPSYTFWRTDDLRRLIEMRNGGAKWASIAAAFPERTLEALKQTYHKRRHAMEAQMAEERAASSEAN